jgi:hypothetical protein
MSSAIYNDLVNETAADLINVKSQLNRILEGITTGADATKVWEDTNNPSTDEHGIDATALYWDSSVDTNTSIYDKVTAVEASVTANLAVKADTITFNTEQAGWTTYDTVDKVLEKIIDNLDETAASLFIDGGTF